MGSGAWPWDLVGVHKVRIEGDAARSVFGTSAETSPQEAPQLWRGERRAARADHEPSPVVRSEQRDVIHGAASAYRQFGVATNVYRSEQRR